MGVVVAGWLMARVKGGWGRKRGLFQGTPGFRGEGASEVGSLPVGPGPSSVTAVL